MKIFVRQPGGDSAQRLALHAEKILRRVLDCHCFSIRSIEVDLKIARDAEGRPEHHCKLKVKLLTDDLVQAAASDGEAILAVYRAADKMIFLLERRLTSGAGT